jgi:hypothetical protein
MLYMVAWLNSCPPPGLERAYNEMCKKFDVMMTLINQTLVHGPNLISFDSSYLINIIFAGLSLEPSTFSRYYPQKFD